MQSLPKASKALSALDCAWELLDASPPMTWHIRRAMREYRGGLSMPQFRAMVKIYNDPSTSLSCVADHVGLSLPTTSRIVTGLVEKGFLKRGGCSKDRRQCALGITARGQAVLNSAWSAAQQSMARELEHFTPRERAAVADAMRVIKQVFGSLGLPRDNGKCQNGKDDG
jgi:DNA-binding MarR family transcriptional regulator